MTKITGTLHEDYNAFLIISRPVLLGMKNVSDKTCRKKNTHTFSFRSFFFPENRADYVIMWKQFVAPDRPTMTARVHTHTKQYTQTHTHTTHTHTQTHTLSEYVLLIAFPRQQRLRERASLLPYTHIACLVKYWYSSRRFSRPGVVLASWRGMPFNWWSRRVLRYLVDDGHGECSPSGTLRRRPYVSWLPRTIQNWERYKSTQFFMWSTCYSWQILIELQIFSTDFQTILKCLIARKSFHWGSMRTNRHTHFRIKRPTRCIE
jgi:hypothetical protein